MFSSDVAEKLQSKGPTSVAEDGSAAADRDEQARTRITYQENRFTPALDVGHTYRGPLPCEARTYELTGLTLPAGRRRFGFKEVEDVSAAATPLDYEGTATAGVWAKRLIEHGRTLYRRDYLSARCQHIAPSNACHCDTRLGVALARGFVRWPEDSDAMPDTPVFAGTHANVSSLYGSLPRFTPDPAALATLTAAQQSNGTCGPSAT